jgi:urease accessory protein UreF
MSLTMFTSEKILHSEPAELLGDWHPLVSQLGSTEGLAEFAAVAGRLGLAAVGHEAGLREFLTRYTGELLLPVELPAIRRAFGHASRNELRELIAFDREQALDPALRDFASASRRVGQEQLRRLKPLRDHRFVQRYLLAVNEGRAEAWHTLVYGMTLAVYSLPLRQGLLHYGAETLRGFAQLACRSVSISEIVLREMLDERFAELVASVDALLPVETDNFLRAV